MNAKSIALSVFALTLCLAIPVSIAAQQTQPAEPQYNDRSLNSWMKDLDSADKRTRLVAADAIARMGPQAKPALPALIKLLNDPEKSIRMSGIVAIARIGAEAKPALPILQQLTTDPDPNISKAAKLAIEAIEPSFKTLASEWLTSVQAIWAGTGALLLGVALVGLVLVRRRNREPKRQKPREPKPAAAPPQPAAPAEPAVGRSANERRRVSQAVPGYDDGPRDRVETAETVKRTLTHAQEEFKKVSERQVEIGNILESKEIAGDPDRMLQLRSEADKLSAEHYWHEVRTKGLEVKLLDRLMSDATTAGTELRVRSAGVLQKKWDELAELCRTPAKVTWEGGQWSRRNLGEPIEVEDLRLHLVEYGVSLPEGFHAPAPAPEVEEPDTELALEEKQAEAESQG